MTIDADQAAIALRSAWLELSAAAGDAAWCSVDPDGVAMVTGLPLPTMNGVWVTSDDPDPASVSGLLEEVRGHDVPFCLQGRASSRAVLREIAVSLGLAADDDVPLMVLDDTGRLPAAIPGLSIRRLEPDEYDEHSELAAAGFAAPIEVFAALTDIVRHVPRARFYVGAVDGVPVSTAMTLMSDGGHAGLFNVATPPEHRRHGYGAALTAHACIEALSDGADWLWLQSSADGFPVYEGIGFRTVEVWPLWVSASH